MEWNGNLKRLAWILLTKRMIQPFGKLLLSYGIDFQFFGNKSVDSLSWFDKYVIRIPSVLGS